MKKTSFATQLIYWIGLAGTGLMLIMALAFWAASRQSVAKASLELNQQVLLQVEQNLKNLDRSIRNIGVLLYSNHDLPLVMKDKAWGMELSIRVQLLESFRLASVDSNPLIHALYFFDLTKDIHYALPMRSLWEDTDLVPLMTKALGPHGEISPFIRTLTDTSDTKVISFVLTSGTEKTHAIPQQGIVINLAAAAVTAAIKDRVFILDGSGALIEQAGETSPSLLSDLQTLIQTSPNPRADSTHTLGGSSYQVSVLRLESLGWTLVKLTSTKEIFRHLNDLEALLIWITLGSLALTLLSSLVISRRLYQPIGTLLADLRNQFKSDLPSDGDEFSYLRAVFHDRVEAKQMSDQQKGTTSRILVHYFLKNLMADSSSVTPEEIEAAQKAGLSLDLNLPLGLVVLKSESPSVASEKLAERMELLRNLGTTPTERIDLDDHISLLLFNQTEVWNTENPLWEPLRRFHEDAASQGMPFSVILADGPHALAQVSTAMSTGLEALRSIRILKKGLILTAEQVRNSRKHNSLIEAVHHLIELEYADPALNVDKIAATMKMTSHYLSKVYRSTEGKSIFEYLTDVRIRKSAELLAQSDILSIKEVMAQVGIESSSFFYKNFKAQLGITPREYVLKNSVPSMPAS